MTKSRFLSVSWVVTNIKLSLTSFIRNNRENCLPSMKVKIYSLFNQNLKTNFILQFNSIHNPFQGTNGIWKSHFQRRVYWRLNRENYYQSFCNNMQEEEEGSTVILQGCRPGLVNRKYSIYLYNKHTINSHNTPPAPRISLASVKLYYKPSGTEFFTELFCYQKSYLYKHVL